MKPILPVLFFLFLLTYSGSAQIVLRRESFPKPGDTLYTGVDNLPSNISVTPPGGDQRWDYSNLQAPFTRQQIVRTAAEGRGGEGFPGADLMISLADNLEAYYKMSSDRSSLLGYFGTDPLGLGVEVLTRFSPALPERRAQLRYRDSGNHESNLSIPLSTDDLPRQVLDRFPITPDSLRIRIRIFRQDQVDAWGKMIIPGGIYDVLREKRVETRVTRLDAKIGFLPWQDITDLVPSLGQLGEFKTTSYHFFSNEAKEPVVVLYLDENERNITRAEFKSNDVSSNVQSIGSLKPGVYAFPNPAIVNVRFEFSNLPAGEYTLTIYNILGVEQWRRNYYINGSRAEKVNISEFRKGTYLYSLTNARGKTIATKRLIVIKP